MLLCDLTSNVLQSFWKTQVQTLKLRPLISLLIPEASKILFQYKLSTKCWKQHKTKWENFEIEANKDKEKAQERPEISSEFLLYQCCSQNILICMSKIYVLCIKMFLLCLKFLNWQCYYFVP